MENFSRFSSLIPKIKTKIRTNKPVVVQVPIDGYTPVLRLITFIPKEHTEE